MLISEAKLEAEPASHFPGVVNIRFDVREPEVSDGIIRGLGIRLEVSEQGIRQRITCRVRIRCAVAKGNLAVVSGPAVLILAVADHQDSRLESMSSFLPGNIVPRRDIYRRGQQRKVRTLRTGDSGCAPSRQNTDVGDSVGESSPGEQLRESEAIGSPLPVDARWRYALAVPGGVNLGLVHDLWRNEPGFADLNAISRAKPMRWRCRQNTGVDKGP